MGPDDLPRTTTCDAFDLAALLDHLTQSVERFVITLGGGAPRNGAGDAPADRLDRLRHANLDAWRHADLDGAYELPLGRLPASLVADVNLSEIVIHGWDVGRATDERADVPDHLADDVLRIGHTLLGDRARDGAFAAPVAIADDSAPSDRMAAFYGRHP